MQQFSAAKRLPNTLSSVTMDAETVVVRFTGMAEKGVGTENALTTGSPPRAPGAGEGSLGHSASSRSLQRVFSKLNFSPQTVTWEALRDEAEMMVERDEFMATVVQEKIIKHKTFAEAIAESLSLVFHSATIPSSEWLQLFLSVYHDPDVVYETSDMLKIEKMGLLDLGAVRERDPASNGLVNPFLFFKGYKAIQAHRIAHVLWNQGRKDVARAIQSRCSEIWSVDIHPASKIGAGLMIDHGTGVVIGETAVIGNNCSFLHGVTLGSTGKAGGDRHPKLGNDILIGSNATILGNIVVGSNTKIGSGSIVLKSLPCCVTAVGNPARIVGRSKCSSAANNMDLALHNVQYCLDLSQLARDSGGGGIPGNTGSAFTSASAARGDWSQHLQIDPSEVFSQVDKTGCGTLSREEVATAMGLRFGLSPPPHVLQPLFSALDIAATGRIDRAAFEYISTQLITFQAAIPEHASLLKEWETYAESASSISKFLLARARLEIMGAGRAPTGKDEGNVEDDPAKLEELVGSALSMD